MKQKHLKTEFEIDNLKKEEVNVERLVHSLEKRLMNLNVQCSERKGYKESLDNQNMVSQNQLICDLKVPSVFQIPYWHIKMELFLCNQSHLSSSSLNILYIDSSWMLQHCVSLKSESYLIFPLNNWSYLLLIPHFNGYTITEQILLKLAYWNQYRFHC